MVHYLMKSPQQLPKFRAYLAGLPGCRGRGQSRRVRRKTLGSLEKLDHETRTQQHFKLRGGR